jgi:uncharacterized membrane protein
VPESVFGLPLHPLVVHGAIVLVPISALLTIIIAISADRRRRWGLLTWLLTTAAVGATVAAKVTGETLRDALYPDAAPVAVVQHADYGWTSVWFAFGLWLATSALLLLELDRRRRDGFGGAVLPAVVSVVAIVAGMAATGQVALTAWTGTEVHWAPRVAQED